ncbi:MAG: MerR family transcriptional regulator, heat shock protein HspR [Frankiaceae bacterium]|jgi:MerR family transcriptional regulator/heat shock protein HspR|nr:MerR family transcriptional regulator, heat shock protein HspR [Frankiaceae bacterium]
MSIDGAPPGDDTPVFVISVAAQLSGMHPQTLRQYDRLGLVTPGRAVGGGRRYSARDVELLRSVQELSHQYGVNLAGIKRILELEVAVDALRRRIGELQQELAVSRVDADRRVARARSSLGREMVPVMRTDMVQWQMPGTTERPFGETL